MQSEYSTSRINTYIVISTIGNPISHKFVYILGKYVVIICYRASLLFMITRLTNPHLLCLHKFENMTSPQLFSWIFDRAHLWVCDRSMEWWWRDEVIHFDSTSFAQLIHEEHDVRVWHDTFVFSCQPTWSVHGTRRGCDANETPIHLLLVAHHFYRVRFTVTRANTTNRHISDWLLDVSFFFDRFVNYVYAVREVTSMTSWDSVITYTQHTTNKLVQAGIVNNFWWRFRLLKRIFFT